MDLLEKFAAVEIKTDERITEADRNYCDMHQKAYEAAISGFQELASFWEKTNKTQEKLLGDRKSSFFHDYLTSYNGPTISQTLIDHHIEALHSDFIMNLIRYFNSTYHVTVESAEIVKTLLPEKPDGYQRSNCVEVSEKYQAQMQSLVVRYQDVVDQIILRLDGRSFSEQAFYELRTKCHSAAWNANKQAPDYARKKDTISFTGYFCRFRGWPYDGWELDDGMKDILYGAAHYETGSFNVLPVGFSCVAGYQDIQTDVVEFPTSEKVKQMKLFKNNRVDLKFRSPEYAEQFVTDYLGTVC